MPKYKGKYTGWSVRGRPFSPTEFKKSHLKSEFRGSYANYLAAWSRQYKKPNRRKGLLK